MSIFIVFALFLLFKKYVKVIFLANAGFVLRQPEETLLTQVQEEFEISTGVMALCAQIEVHAARLQHAEITPIHLLMALVAADSAECFATKTLLDHKLTSDKLFEVVVVKIGRGTAPTDTVRRFSSELECICDRARHDAIRYGHRYADSAILCCALMMRRDIQDIVRDCGADPWAIFDELEMNAGGDREPQVQWTDA